MCEPQQLFTSNVRDSDIPVIETIWRSQSSHAGEFLSVAVSRWELVIMHLAGQIRVTVRGPETQATLGHCPADGTWLGVTFKLGTYMPNLPTIKLVDTAINLPDAGSRSFWLSGASWEIPTYENIEVFVARLLRQGLLVHDPVAVAVLQRQTSDCSLRTTQRRFLHTTGLTYGAICQIERAQRATALLQQGVSIPDTVELAGYADQPHLTRSLKRFIGQTPAQLLASPHNRQLSLFSTAQ